MMRGPRIRFMAANINAANEIRIHVTDGNSAALPIRTLASAAWKRSKLEKYCASACRRRSLTKDLSAREQKGHQTHGVLTGEVEIVVQLDFNLTRQEEIDEWVDFTRKKFGIILLYMCDWRKSVIFFRIIHGRHEAWSEMYEHRVGGVIATISVWKEPGFDPLIRIPITMPVLIWFYIMDLPVELRSRPKLRWALQHVGKIAFLSTLRLRRRNRTCARGCIRVDPNIFVAGIRLRMTRLHYIIPISYDDAWLRCWACKAVHSFLGCPRNLGLHEETLIHQAASTSADIWLVNIDVP